MNKEILIDKKEEKKKRVAINQLRNAEDKAGAKARKEKEAPREEERTIRKILYTQKKRKRQKNGMTID